MTRKEYALIARTLRDDAAHLALDEWRYESAPAWQRGAYDQWSTTVLAIGKALQTDGGYDVNGNRRFQIDRFLDSAGLSGQGVAAPRTIVTAYSADPTTGLQPTIGQPAESWVYRHARPVKSAGYVSPFRSGRARNLTADRAAREGSAS